MWGWVVPCVEAGLASLSPDTVADWGCGLATSCRHRHPATLAPLLQTLTSHLLTGGTTSFREAARLYVLQVGSAGIASCIILLPPQGVLAQQRWRAGPLLHSLLAQLRPLLAHPYHNIRCRLAAALTNIFAFDLEFEGYGNANKSSPHEEEFVREVLPLLAPLEEAGAGEGREAALRLLQTLAKWVAGSCLAGVRGPAPCLLRLLPHLLGQDWQEADPQLAGDCRLALARLATAPHRASSLAGLVTTLEQVAASPSWRTRVSCLEFLETLLHSSFMVLARSGQLRPRLVSMVMGALNDAQIEVRVQAAQVITEDLTESGRE